jgi:hypothetical protein
MKILPEISPSQGRLREILRYEELERQNRRAREAIIGYENSPLYCEGMEILRPASPNVLDSAAFDRYVKKMKVALAGIFLPFERREIIEDVFSNELKKYGVYEYPMAIEYICSSQILTAFSGKYRGTESFIKNVCLKDNQALIDRDVTTLRSIVRGSASLWDSERRLDLKGKGLQAEERRNDEFYIEDNYAFGVTFSIPDLFYPSTYRIILGLRPDTSKIGTSENGRIQWRDNVIVNQWYLYQISQDYCHRILQIPDCVRAMRFCSIGMRDAFDSARGRSMKNFFLKQEGHKEASNLQSMIRALGSSAEMLIVNLQADWERYWQKGFSASYYYSSSIGKNEEGPLVSTFVANMPEGEYATSMESNDLYKQFDAITMGDEESKSKHEDAQNDYIKSGEREFDRKILLQIRESLHGIVSEKVLSSAA